MPWVHLHVTQNGTVAPCCQAPCDAKNSFGDIKEQSIDEIWYGKEMNAFRSKMLKGEKDSRCLRCYEKEDSNWISLRKITNEKYLHHLQRIEQTSKRGELANMPPVYFDLRFSNVCNFKCRICGPWSSSKWHKDAVELGMKNESDPSITSAADSSILLNELEAHLDELEEIYFAGGEPLVMNDHYHVLEMLIKHNKTDVKLFYNTNFSVLNYKDYDLMKLWGNFPNINIAASLDASGERGEFLRKEQNWAQTVENRKRIADELPHVNFMISPTVYALNLLHLPDFHKEWVDAGFIEVEDFIPTMLIQPEAYNIRVLPFAIKEKARELYENHLDWMKAQFKTNGDVEKMNHAVQQFKNVLVHLFDADHNHLLPELKKKSAELDALRGESLSTVFPELSTLFS